MKSTTQLSESTTQHEQGTRRLMVGTTVALATLIIGLGGWSSLAKVRSAVLASGKVVVEGDTKKIQHAEGGIIGELLVKEGDFVTRGQTVMRLDATKTRSELNIVLQRLFDLQVQRARLIAQRDNKPRITFPAFLQKSIARDPRLANQLLAQQRLLASNRARVKSQLGQSQSRITQLRNEIKGLKIQQKAKSREIIFVNNDIRRYKTLERKKLISRTKMNDKRRMLARLIGEQGRLTSDIARAMGQISEMQIRATEISNGTLGEVLKELNQLSSQIAELSQRKITALDKLSRIDIKAPCTGRIHELAVHTIGGVVEPGELLMKVVPDNGKLIIEAKVLPTDIDQVFVGKLARIRFSAFNQRTTPELEGQIITLSPDQSIDPQTGMPFYTARIALKQDEQAKLAGKTLIPGMPSDVMMVGKNRTVLNYLIKPLANQLNRAFREG